MLLAAIAVCAFAGAAPALALTSTGPGGATGGELPSPASPEALTAAELVAEARDRDGERVRVYGEAIGDVMSAEPGHVWVNVLSDGTAIGLWMPSADARTIQRLGDYDNTGTSVEAVGIFNYACDQHHGDPDVHVESIKVIGAGGPREQPVRWWKLSAGAAIAAIAAIFAFLYRRDVRRVG